MKSFLTIILLLVMSCKGPNNAEGKKKRKDIIEKIVLLQVLSTVPRQSTKYPSPLYCGINSSTLKTNLKAIEIYHASILFLSNPIDEFNIYEPRFCEPLRYEIRLEENTKINTISVYYHKRDGQTLKNYIGVGLYFKDKTFKEYTMNFNGDPDTFTEFTAGEYRFVAVR